MKHRILIVEDTEDNLRIARDLLNSAGYDLLEATDGAAGVSMAALLDPDLILMDIQLPKLDGYEATRRIRKRRVSRPAATPISQNPTARGRYSRRSAGSSTARHERECAKLCPANRATRSARGRRRHGQGGSGP